MQSQPPSESDQARAFVHPQPSESLPALLHRVIPSVQRRRAAAYSRLQTALRRSSRPNEDSNPSHVPPLTVPESDYGVVCANVTEDLKLASEAIIELRTVLVRSEFAERRMAVKWLDLLQDLEERKLVATVSLHAVQRSGGRGDGVLVDVREKVSKYAKELNQVDGEINELLGEVREYCLDFVEEHGEVDT